MHVICCPDSFKESLSAVAAAEAMARGVRRAMPGATVDVCPIADGGEGTVAALVDASGGRFESTEVIGPLGQRRVCTWGWLGDGGDSHVDDQTPATAVIELAAASGLALVPSAQRDPTRTTSYGTGELIAAALAGGAERIILGIGGSATNDAGCGAAQALGVCFYDQNDQRIDTPITGGDLSRIGRIDMSNRNARLDQAELTIACDVTNPLYGENGAAYVYAPQKGASPQQVEALDAGLAHIAPLMQKASGRPIEDCPGAGAAGGFGGGAVALLNGLLEPGVERVLKALDFERRVAAADVCLTGEGKLDAQSLSGKAIAGVIGTAREHHVAVIALAGQIEADAATLQGFGLSAWRAISEGVTIERAMREPAPLLEDAAATCINQWQQRSSAD
jgi:glycerate kinase